jgi:hypothetical protein
VRPVFANAGLPSIDAIESNHRKNHEDEHRFDPHLVRRPPCKRLHKQVMTKLAESGGKVPDSLKA